MGHKYFGPLTAFLAMNQLASDGPTAITATEPVICVSVDCHGKGVTLMLGYILPLVIRRIGHNCQIQFALDGPTAIKPVVMPALSLFGQQFDSMWVCLSC